MRITVRHDDENCGPYSVADVNQLLIAGQLDDDDLAARLQQQLSADEASDPTSYDDDGAVKNRVHKAPQQLLPA